MIDTIAGIVINTGMICTGILMVLGTVYCIAIVIKSLKK